MNLNEKPFNRIDAESLLSPTGTNNCWVIDDRGIWPNAEWSPAIGTGNRIDFDFDSWRPAVMLANNPSPQRLVDIPALSFPFDAKDLAAFMLYGYGALVADHYGDWGNGPDSERLGDLFPMDYSRRAVKEAFDAYREAEKNVGPFPLEIDAKAERARKAWNKANSEKDKSAIAALDAEMKTTSNAAKAAQKQWLEAMVRQLVQSVPAKDTATPAPTVGTSDEPPNPKNRKPSWVEKAMPYMKKLYASGKYRSNSVFYRALKKRVNDDDSPFTLVNGELYCDEAGTTVAEATLGNVWKTVRAAVP